MKRLLTCMMFGALVAAGVGTAHADAENGFGFRAGFGVDPDQFVVGAQADAGPLFGFARFAPSIDLGFGDNLSTYTFNADVMIPLPIPSSGAELYAGGGPAITYWNPDAGDGDLEIGVSIVGGIQLPFRSNHSYNLETRFGISDVPDFRILIGILFGAGR